VIALGIDPGLAFLGVGVLEVKASSTRVIHHETFKTKSSDDDEDRLDAIADYLGDVIDAYDPQVIGYENQAIVEAGKQARARAARKAGKLDEALQATSFSSARVHEVAGIIRCAARFYGLPCYCLAPSSVKLAVLGKGGGKAKKERVKLAVKTIFRVTASEHAADAIAISVGVMSRYRRQQAQLRAASSLIH
jgi:Holliday junction resolvasome RuvABC endonuclease subunit